MGKKNQSKKVKTPIEKAEEAQEKIKENKKNQRKNSNKSEENIKNKETVNKENEKKENKKSKKNKKENKKEEEQPVEAIEEEEENYEELLKKKELAQTEVDKLMPNLDQNLMKKAIKISSEEIKKKYLDSMNLLSNESDEFLYVNFAFSKLPLKITLRPNLINLTNSIYGDNYNSNICLFVKDPKSDFKNLEIKFPFNLKVMDISKLKLKYDRFEQRRELLKKYDLFLCDLRIYFVLRKFLGKPFYASKKYPIPIKLNYENKDEILAEVTKHVEHSSIFHICHGPIYNLKFCRSVMNDKEKLENLNCAIKETLPHIMKFGVGIEE